MQGLVEQADRSIVEAVDGVDGATEIVEIRLRRERQSLRINQAVPGHFQRLADLLVQGTGRAFQVFAQGGVVRVGLGQMALQVSLRQKDLPQTGLQRGPPFGRQCSLCQIHRAPGAHLPHVLGQHHGLDQCGLREHVGIEARVERQAKPVENSFTHQKQTVDQFRVQPGAFRRLQLLAGHPLLQRSPFLAALHPLRRGLWRSRSRCQRLVHLVVALRQRTGRGGSFLLQLRVATQHAGGQPTVLLGGLDHTIDFAQHLRALDLAFGLGSTLEGQAQIQGGREHHHHQSQQAQDHEFLGQAQSVQEGHGGYR